MYSVLLSNGMYLIIEGFLNGYVLTEAAVDRLHVLVYTELTNRIN